jgi:membrane-associated protease RseP (regulator of RpoE activity)
MGYSHTERLARRGAPWRSRAEEDLTMDGYLVLLVLVAIYFAVVLAGARRNAWKRLDISFYGPILIWRTLKGHELLSRIAGRRLPWRLIGTASIAVAFASMAALTAFLVWVTVFAPEVVKVATYPSEVIGATPVVNPAVTITFAVVGMAAAILIHEVGHGLLAIVEKVKVEALGVMVLAIPVGAFVETNDDDLERSPRSSALKMYAAGSATNFLVSALCLALFLFVLAPCAKSVHEGALVTGIVPGSPADHFGIPIWAEVVEVDGARVTSSDELRAMSVESPGGLTNVMYRYESDLVGAVVTSGVVVSRVPEGPAFNAGIEPGMIIRSLDGTVINSIGELRSVEENASRDGPVNITVLSYYDDPGIDLSWYVENSSISNVNLTSKWVFHYINYPGDISEDYRNLSCLGVEVTMLGLQTVDSDHLVDVMARPLSDASGAEGYASASLQFLALPFLGYMPMISPATDLYEPSGALAFLPSEVFWLLLNMVYWFFWANAMVGIANSLPMYPMDGGVMLRKGLRLLRERFGRRRIGLDRITGDRWLTEWEGRILIDAFVAVMTILVVAMFAWHIVQSMI